VSKALHTTQKPPSHIPSHWQISHVVHDVVIYIIIHPYILAILKYFLSERLKAPVVTTHQKSYRVRGKRRGVFLNPRRGDQAHDGWLLRGDVTDNGCHEACHLASPLGHLRYMPSKYPPTLQNNTKHVFWWNACLTPQDCTMGLQIWSTTMPRLHHVTPHDLEMYAPRCQCWRGTALSNASYQLVGDLWWSQKAYRCHFCLQRERVAICTEIRRNQ